MSLPNITRRLGAIPVIAAATLAVAAFALPSAPAKAQVYFGVGPFGFAVGAPSPYYYDPYYTPYYYPPPYYYWHHHHPHW
ncbi:MAG TPA: hypothetical protein VMF86_02770 [Stellaceae bacterium]|nr:hypothetical protein [Stellaceae bacterium]